MGRDNELMRKVPELPHERALRIWMQMGFGLFGRNEDEKRPAVHLRPALEAFDQRDGRENE